jgi:hypothetical protein
VAHLARDLNLRHLGDSKTAPDLVQYVALSPGVASVDTQSCKIEEITTPSACPSPETSEVLLAAIVLARTGTPAALQTVLSNVSCLADIIMLVYQEVSEAPELQQVREGMPCTPKVLQHNVTWSNSLSKALNLAMVSAEKDAGEGMG